MSQLGGASCGPAQMLGVSDARVDAYAIDPHQFVLNETGVAVQHPKKPIFIVFTAIVSAVFGTLIFSPTAFAAETYPTQAGQTYTETSADVPVGAKGVVKVIIENSSEVKLNWTNTDLRPDGKGPILQIDVQACPNGVCSTKTIVYNHVTTGSGNSESGTKDYTSSNIRDIFILECNGGSSSAPENCDSLGV